MSLRLGPFPAYKESGSAAIGPVPVHWSAKPLKHWVSKNTGSLPETTDNDYTFRYLDIGTVGTGNLARRPTNLRFGDAPSRARRIVRSGDTIVSTVRTYLKAVYTVGHDDSDLIASTGFAVLRPGDEIDSGFLSYAVRAEPFVERVVAESVGVAYPGISETRLGALVLFVPSTHSEQHQIAAFLDHADRRINRLIRAKRALIELLNEQKQAIIQRAVTRGLDPNVRIKPSGIDWLAGMPEHWEVTRSKRLFTVRKELARPDDIQLSATQAYGVIPQSEFEEKVGRRVVKISLHLEKRRHVERDDFVISMRSFQGGLERAWAPGAIRSSYVVLRPEPDVDVGYFSYLLKSPGYIRALQATAGFIRDGQDLTFDDFCRVDLPLVPLDEQRGIAAHIGAETVQIEATASRGMREIELLREYRTRLIADVVTGKLDVRGVELPPVDEGDALDEIDAPDDGDADADIIDDGGEDLDGAG